MLVRLVNPSGTGGEKMAHKKHHYKRYRRNPFGVGSMSKLAVKVAGGLAGGIGAAAIPNMVSPSLASGWAGVLGALAIAFGGSMLLKSSPDFSEGVLIGGTLQAAGRVSALLLGKNVVSFSLSGYGPLPFTIPTPAYNVMKSGGGMIATIPASSGQGKPVRAMPAAATTMGSMWGPRRNHWGARAA